jgi:(S)-ureidoglycine aminohydrolase
MQHLGQTRSSYRRDHLLQTPDTFVRAPLPGMEKATAIVHIAPAAGAQFTQYTAEFEEGGTLGPTSAERFLYMLEGSISVAGKTLGPRAYAYLPPCASERIESAEPARATVIEKPYVPLAGVAAPAMFISVEADLPAQPLLGDPDVLVRALIPADTAFDFAVNTLTFAPGAALPLVEIHVMEHGLLMLEGGGIYRLGDEWHPVTEGDFIWMAPYCPQWFGAIGKTPAKYLLYKDWNRHPLE